ncbi:MAG TPA: GDYXXLXY domain-containing protein [Anaerohalosphaeraceae bacterium]|nr:GDYXXLXY domain-containing protein [Anaerohalosphaeraceae bacterium]
MLWGTLLVSGFFWPMSVQNTFEHRFPEYTYATAASLLGLVFFCWGLAGWKSPRGRFVSVPCWTVGLFWCFLAVFLASFIDYAKYMVTEAVGKKDLPAQYPLLITAGVLAAGAVGLAVYSGPVLKKGPDDIWSLESLSQTLPTNLSPEQIAVKGTVIGHQIEYGIENFYIPEKDRNELERALRTSRKRALAQIRVDKYGNDALIRLIVQGKRYEY